MLLLILAVASGLFLTKAEATVHKYNPRHSFHASLYAAPNVTGVNSTGNGTAHLIYDESSSAGIFADLGLDLDNLNSTVVGVHLHAGKENVNGPILLVGCGSSSLLVNVLFNNITVLSPPCAQNSKNATYPLYALVGNVTILDTWYAIRDDAIDPPLDDFYIDVHTLSSEAQFPTRAAIRGQISADAGWLGMLSRA